MVRISSALPHFGRCRSADESLRRLKVPHARRWYLLGFAQVCRAWLPLVHCRRGHGILPPWAYLPKGSRRAGLLASAKMYCVGLCIACGLAEPELGSEQPILSRNLSPIGHAGGRTLRTGIGVTRNPSLIVVRRFSGVCQRWANFRGRENELC